jgi:hypothetical protein
MWIWLAGGSRLSPSSSDIRPPAATRQVAFHQLLVGARQTWLVDSLQETLAGLDPQLLRTQLGQLLPNDAGNALAAAGVRDEYVFPTPAVLEARPTLLGYYRLLMGVSQKAFYQARTGLSRFKSMEVAGLLRPAQRQSLEDLCKALAQPLADLIRQMSPAVTPRDVSELPLLTLGSQFQGGNNNTIGQQATLEVFLAVSEVVAPYISSRTERRLTVVNAAGRSVIIALAADPDVRIQEQFNDSLRSKVAIEIKGGTDKSNVHNRAGEAEKSHQKARNEGFRDFWTIILTQGVDLETLKSESPTTNSWFDVSQVLARTGDDWEEFKSRVAGEVGIPIH